MNHTFTTTTPSSATLPATTVIQRIVVGLIHLYQHTLSPDHGPLFRNSTIGCRFYPSCSEYMARAVIRYGSTQGIAKGIQRLLRCTPWTAGGVDDIH